jgi:hypothetical protein
LVVDSGAIHSYAMTVDVSAAATTQSAAISVTPYPPAIGLNPDDPALPLLPEIASVPEPSTLVLLGFGALTASLWGRSRMAGPERTAARCTSHPD